MKNRSPSPASLPQAGEPSNQQRKRMLLGTAVIALTLVGLLTWFLLHPSSASSPARKVKDVIFGPRLTQAAEQFAGTSGGTGEGPTDSGGAGGPSRPGGDPSGNAVRGAAGGNEGAAGTAGPGGASGSAGQGHGTPLTAPIQGPVNPQGPTNNPPELPAPEARSIGWLDRFFGTTPMSEHTPIRPGEGGTSEHHPGSGNTNPSPASTTSAPVAAEFTRTNPPASNEISLDEPPTSVRSTNRPAGNSTLNDNFEQLLRQHRAGSGDVRISLMWSNKNDLDLHVLDPHGEEIFYGHRMSASGGLLDIDMNASPPFRVPAVENVFWPQRAAPGGSYSIYVNHYAQHDVANMTSFTVRILVRGRTTDFAGSIRFGEPKKLVNQFTLPGLSAGR